MGQTPSGVEAFLDRNIKMYVLWQEDWVFPREGAAGMKARYR